MLCLTCRSSGYISWTASPETGDSKEHGEREDGKTFVTRSNFNGGNRREARKHSRRKAIVTTINKNRGKKKTLSN